MNPQTPHRATPRAMVGSLVRHRHLIAELVRRDVVGRYRGSVVGLAWSLLNPLLMLVVYTFVFSVVFKARWGTDPNETRSQFAITLFAGLIVYTLFAECVNRAPGLIVGNANYVKKVVFPLEILPVVTLGSATFHLAVSAGALLVVMLALGYAIPWTVLLLPVAIVPTGLAALGMSWLLASIGTYLRDVGQVVGVLMTVLMFMTPIFYPVTALPPSFRPWMLANPLSYGIELSRDLLIWGRLPSPGAIALYAAGSAALSIVGFWWFQKTRKGFADVL